MKTGLCQRRLGRPTELHGKNLKRNEFIVCSLNDEEKALSAGEKKWRLAYAGYILHFLLVGIDAELKLLSVFFL
ncbi:hypothetical protein D9O50_04490 [Oxalobacteraceae bacterium CAVE-383]|nr:hypothetical protein D9O50_04490 [Oxalobacteraceae bacterium CAVE-383]